MVPPPKQTQTVVNAYGRETRKAHTVNTTWKLAKTTPKSFLSPRHFYNRSSKLT